MATALIRPIAVNVLTNVLTWESSVDGASVTTPAPVDVLDGGTP